MYRLLPFVLKERGYKEAEDPVIRCKYCHLRNDEGSYVLLPY